MTKKKAKKVTKAECVPDLEDPTEPELVQDGAILLLERCLETLRVLKDARRIDTVERWEMLRRLAGEADPKPCTNLELDLAEYLGDI